MLAKDLMSSPVVTVDPGHTVGSAARMMLEHNVSALPVVDDRGRLVGILTHSDFGMHPRYLPHSAMGSMTSPQHIEEVSRRMRNKLVRDVMETHLFTTGVDDSVAHMTELMLRHSIRRLPVLDGGTLVGIVTRHDFLKLIAQDE